MNGGEQVRGGAAMWVLLVSGFCGFLLGSLAHGSWQVAVESGQVLAGLVEYPPQNPFYIYHVKLWTLANQVAALLLHVFGEITVSLILSGVLGMVCFQALALCVFALSSNLPAAIAAPFFVYVTHATEYGIAYPISLMATEHTYGVLGLGWVVLTLACFGAGCHRLGGLLLGLAPAVHASLGAWLYLIVVICLVWDRSNVSGWLRKTWKPFLAGFGLCIVSFLVQMGAASNAPQGDPSVEAHYLSTFVRYWDGHRMPVSFFTRQVDPGGGVVTSLNRGICLLLSSGILSFVWLRWFRKQLPPASPFLLRAVFVSAVMGLLFIPLSWIKPEEMPATLLVLMPSRLANVAVFVFIAILFGLLAGHRGRTWPRGLLLAFLLLSVPTSLILGFADSLIKFQWVQQHVAQINLALKILQPWNLMVATAAAFLLGIGICRLRGKRGAGVSGNPVAPANAGRFLRWAVISLWVVWLLFACLSGFRGWQYRKSNPMRDRTNDPMLAEISRRPGLLLTGGSLHFIQLWARRPVLLDGGALDMLPYALAAGPEMDLILRDAYGISLARPPQEAIGSGTVPHNTARAIWESWPVEKWRQIKQQFNVTGVLASADWRLPLPVVMRDDRFALYDLP